MAGIERDLIQLRKQTQSLVFDKSLRDIVGPDFSAAGNTPAVLREKARRMDPARRRRLKKAVREYRKSCDRNALEIQKALTLPGLSGTQGLGKIIVRGSGIGLSAAGVVNTAAPGLFSTSMGYIAGSLKGTGAAAVLSKLGLLSIGTFTPPVFTQGAILALGATAGVIVYALCAGVKKLLLRCRK